MNNVSYPVCCTSAKPWLRAPLLPPHSPIEPPPSILATAHYRAPPPSTKITQLSLQVRRMRARFFCISDSDTIDQAPCFHVEHQGNPSPRLGKHHLRRHATPPRSSVQSIARLTGVHPPLAVSGCASPSPRRRHRRRRTRQADRVQLKAGVLPERSGRRYDGYANYY